MAEGSFVRDAAGLGAHLEARGEAWKKLDNGTLAVVVELMPKVLAGAALRWAPQPGLFECVTLLPLPVPPANRAGVAAALFAANKTLALGAFVLTGEGVFFNANALLNGDGTLSTRVVDAALAATRAACQQHFKTLLLAATAAPAAATPAAPAVPTKPAGPQLLSYLPSRLTDEQTAALRLLTASDRPTFAHRMAQPVTIEEVQNPWFKKHRILQVQSPIPMPAMGIMVAALPDGSLKMLSGNPGAINELAAHETVTFADDAAARAYANVTSDWTRSSDWPELPVGGWDEIPWRPSLSADDKAAIERARSEVAGRLAPRAFTRQDAGWRLDAWLMSSSRLVHRVVDLAADGSVTVKDEVVVPQLPVPPGKAWGRVGDRFVPIG